jgi:antitoxin HicB
VINDRHTGSSFESFLAEEGILEEIEAVAAKRVISWLLRHNTAEVVPADVALYRLANSFDREAANRI